MSATQLNTVALAAFLAERLPQSGQPGLQVEPVAGGQSNPTFFVQWGSRALVLRKKPAGDTLPSAHAVDREARVMQALASTPVPVPHVVLFHADPGLLGTPFYLMDRVPGRVFPSSDLPGASPAERRQGGAARRRLAGGGSGGLWPSG
jgi:aminoglycoside phosphotransferase (APT) family kinase protein